MPGTRHESPYKGTLNKLFGCLAVAKQTAWERRLVSGAMKRKWIRVCNVAWYYMQSIFGPERVSSTFRSTMQISGSAAK